MGGHAVEEVTVIAVAAILDEHGVLDAGPAHVVEERLYRLVFVQPDVAVGVDNRRGHTRSISRRRGKDSLTGCIG